MVCVPLTRTLKRSRLIQLFLDLLDFDFCHHHSPFRMSRSLRSRASLTAVAKCSCEARAFSTLGFLIVEIDFASIGAVSGTIVIDGGPARSAPLDAAAASTAQTAAADKADRKRTPFLLCMGLSLAWPIAMAFNFAPARIRRMSSGRFHLDSRSIEDTSVGNYSSRSAGWRIRSDFAGAHKGSGVERKREPKALDVLPRASLGVSSFRISRNVAWRL